MCAALQSTPARSTHTTEMQTGFGHASSSVVDERHVYIVNDNEEHSFIAAYDKRTGNQAWRVDRKEASNWTTPLVWKNEQRTEIVTAGTGGVRSYDDSGKLLGQFTGMSTFAVPSPLAANGVEALSDQQADLIIEVRADRYRWRSRNRSTIAATLVWTARRSTPGRSLHSGTPMTSIGNAHSST
jgi:hypothetical protein